MSRTTDHSDQIVRLRDAAVHADTEQSKVMFEAAAALLEVHDATGISLDNWTGPKQLVNLALREIGKPPLRLNYA